MIRAMLKDVVEIASLLAFIMMIAVWTLALGPLA